MEVYERFKAGFSDIDLNEKCATTKVELRALDLSPKGAFDLIQFLVNKLFGDDEFNPKQNAESDTISDHDCIILDQVLNSLNYLAHPDLLMKTLDWLFQVFNCAVEKQATFFPLGLYIILFDFCKLYALSNAYEFSGHKTAIKRKRMKNIIELCRNCSTAGISINFCILSEILIESKNVEFDRRDLIPIAKKTEFESDQLLSLESYALANYQKHLNIILPKRKRCRLSEKNSLSISLTNEANRNDNIINANGHCENEVNIFTVLCEKSGASDHATLILSTIAQCITRGNLKSFKTVDFKKVIETLSLNFSRLSLADCEQFFTLINRGQLFFALKLLIDSLEICTDVISEEVLEFFKIRLIGCMQILPLWFLKRGEKCSDELEDSLNLCLGILKMKRIKFNLKRIIKDILALICSIDFNQCCKNPSTAFSLTCELLSNVTNFKALVANNVHVLMIIFSRIQSALISFCKDQDLQAIFDHVVKFSRLLSLVCGKFGVDFSKTAPYLIGDFVESIKTQPLTDPRIRGLFLTYIYGWLDLCDEHAVALLATNLNDSSKEIFKMIFEDYKKFFKYKGFV